MAQTERGIKYPYGDDYDENADIPEDLKEMAESIDKAIENSENGVAGLILQNTQDINDIKDEQAEQNTAINKNKNAIGIETNTYNVEETYTLGDIVIQNEKIYKCIEETTGIFDATKWQEISLYEYQKIQDEKLEENYKVITKLQEDLEEERANQITNTPETATELYLNDSAGARFRKLIPIGRTTQESTTGKNKMSNLTAGSNVTINNEVVNQTTADGKTNLEWKLQLYNGSTLVNDLPLIVKNTTGIFSRTFTKDSSFNRIRYGLNGSNRDTLVISDISDLSDGEYILSYNVTNVTQGSISWKNNMIRLSSVTDDTYEPYTGGETSPNPNYEMPIKNTGDNVNIWNNELEIAEYDNTGTKITTTVWLVNTQSINVKPNTKYTVSQKEHPCQYRIIFFEDNTFLSREQNTQNTAIGYTNYTFKTPSNCNKIFIQFRSTIERLATGSPNVQIQDITKVKLEQGTKATPYSPYGCGNVNEKVTNANIWDEEWELGGINNSNGENYASTSLIRSKNYIPVNPNTQLYIKNGTDYAWFYAYDKNKNFLGYAFGTSSSVANEIKTTIANCYYLRFQCRSQYGTTYNNDICINISNTSINGTYIAHEEQNISFPLAQGQKFMEGDYLADDEKVHHVRKQFTLDGSQLMSKFIYNSNLSTTNYNCFLYYDNEIKQATNDTEVFVLADKLKGTPSNQRTSDMANCWINHLSAGQLGMHVPNTITNTTELRTWLTENPITFEVLLATEQTEDFTEEQQTARQEWKKARTYKNITHISSENETPANLEAEYVVDTKTYIDNEISNMKTAIVALGGVV